MNNLKEINIKKPDPDIIRHLEECLEDAKNGDIIECVIVGRMVGGDRLYACLGKDNAIYEMIGMLEESKTRYVIDHMHE